MPSASAPSLPSSKASQDLPAFNHRRGRLSHLILLLVHKELADDIDMVEVAILFVGDNQRHKQLFGKFSKNDQTMKSTFVSKATQTV